MTQLNPQSAQFIQQAVLQQQAEKMLPLLLGGLSGGLGGLAKNVGRSFVPGGIDALTGKAGMEAGAAQIGGLGLIGALLQALGGNTESEDAAFRVEQIKKQRGSALNAQTLQRILEIQALRQGEE